MPRMPLDLSGRHAGHQPNRRAAGQVRAGLGRRRLVEHGPRRLRKPDRNLRRRDPDRCRTLRRGRPCIRRVDCVYCVERRGCGACIRRGRPERGGTSTVSTASTASTVSTASTASTDLPLDVAVARVELAGQRAEREQDEQQDREHRRGRQRRLQIASGKKKLGSMPCVHGVIRSGIGMCPNAMTGIGGVRANRSRMAACTNRRRRRPRPTRLLPRRRRRPRTETGRSRPTCAPLPRRRRTLRAARP